MIILKNTLTYANGEGISEYSDIEVMQMLGRAGRPQYDTSAVAVIMTRQEKAKKYEKMVSGEQILESWLVTEGELDRTRLTTSKPTREPY